MKQKACVFAIFICIATGVLRFLDLLFLSEKDTGFILYGNVWYRYALIAAVIVAIYALAHMQKLTGEIVNINKSPLLFAVIGIVSVFTSIGAAFNAMRQFVLPSTNFGHALSGTTMLTFAFVVRLGFAVSLLVFAVFSLIFAFYKKNVVFEKNFLRTLGLFGAIAFCILPVLEYSQNPASVNRIVNILSVCSTLSALVFYTSFLGVMFKKPYKNQKAQLAASGLICFLMCTCIQLPQTVLLVPQTFSFYSIFLTGLLALIGLLGAITALQLHSSK